MTLTDCRSSVPNVKVITPIHVFFFLLVNPTRWRCLLDQIDPTLPVNFSIASLTPQQRKNPLLWRFLIQNYLLEALIINLIVPIILKLAGASNEIIAETSWLVLGYSMILPLVMASVFGVGSGFVFGGMVALGVGFLARQTDFFFVVIAFAGGITGCLLLNRERRISPIFKGREITGLFTGFLFAWVFIFIGEFVISGDLFGISVGAPGALPLAAPFARLVTITASALYAAVFTFGLAVKARLKLRQAIVPGLAAGVVLAASYMLFLRSAEDTPVYLMAAAVGAGMLMVLLFLIPFILADWAGGPQAAAIAAAYVTGLSWVELSRFLVIGYTFAPTNYLVAIGAVTIGLTFSVWRPIVFLPLTSVWNNLLYSIDRRGGKGPLKYFKYHSAFWEEGQWVRWPALDEYLLLQSERDPAAYQKISLFFASTSQRRVVQSTELELITRLFESCINLDSIAQVYRHAQLHYQDGQIATIIRTFLQMSRSAETVLNQPSLYLSRVILGRLRDDLALFQRELILITNRDVERFTRSAAIWSQIIEQQIEKYTQAATFQHEIENPYICGMPLNKQQEVFVGRTDIMARIEHLLTDPSRPPLHLYGQRRMGKTSLLLNLDHYLPSTIISVFLDAQAMAGFTRLEEFFSYVLDEVFAEGFRQHGLKLPQTDFYDSTSSLFSKVRGWIDAAEKMLSAENLILLVMLDEFEALETFSKLPAFNAKDFIGLSRFINQHRPHLKFMVVGSHTLDEIGPWSTFLINTQVVKIGRLAREEALRLILSPLKNYKLAYDPEASHRILDLTSGHPHLVQSICYELVMLKNEQSPQKRYTAMLSDVEEAARRSLASISFFFVDMRGSQINPGTAAMLDYLADRGEGGTISHSEWTERFPANFDQNLALALKRDLVEQVDGGYQFQIEMVRRWFEKRPF